MWRYPRAEYAADQTGLAVVATTHPAYATDGAAWDAAALMGSHPTLQLPSVARVTHLETGRQILVRLDDRGPEAPGRLLAITPRAAQLLGTGSDPTVLRVRLQVEEGASRQLTAELGDPEAPVLSLAAAPSAAVQTETLAPPAGVTSGPSRADRPVPAAMVPAPSAAPLRLPETVTQVAARPTQLWIDAGGLGQPHAAETLRSRLGSLGARVVREPRARPEEMWRVRTGPWPDVAAADAALDRALRAGVVDPRIVVQ